MSRIITTLIISLLSSMAAVATSAYMIASDCEHGGITRVAGRYFVCAEVKP